MTKLFGGSARIVSRGEGERPLYDLLLVDDDPFFLNLFSRVGELVGLRLYKLAQTVDELQDCLTRYRFKIVFLDHQLIDGVSVSVLRKSSFARLAKESEVIVASGYQRSIVQEIYAPFGVKLFLEKPIAPKALQLALSQALLASRSKVYR